MSNSDKSQGDQREKIYSVIWGSLIFVVVVWWFYPQIRSLIQPNRSAEEIVTPTKVVEELDQETSLETITVEEAPAPQEDTDSSEDQETSLETITVEEAPVSQEDTDSSEGQVTSSETITVEVAPVSQEDTDKNSGDGPELISQLVSAPKFDLVRIEDDGSAVIAGLAEGAGYVVLSLAGRELSEARVDLSGNGQFVIFALLPLKTEPQALQLLLYPEDGSGPIISEDVVFVTAPLDLVVPDVTAELDIIEKQADTETDQVEPAERQSGPAIIVANENGIRVLQDGSGNSSTATVSIDTISYDLLGEVSIGGRANGTGFVRIYLNNRLIATSRITNSGYWKVDLLNIEAGIYKLRADELSESGEVLSRVEIPFKREKPGELVVLMAQASEEDNEEIKLSSAITQTRVNVQDQVVGLVASTKTLRSDEVVTSAIGLEVKTEPAVGRLEIPILSIEFRIKTVQPGSTLWAIAKERYGSGIEYHKVFEANKERIRDPDLIYPGQVFEIPD